MQATTIIENTKSPYNGPTDPNYNPLTSTSRIIYNFVMDKKIIQEKEEKARNHIIPFYPAFDSQIDNCILSRELLIAKKSKNMQSGKKLQVFSCLNNAGDTTQNLFDFERQHTVVGVALIEGKYDVRSENNNRSGVSGQMGGSTTIKNTGNQKIVSGDLIMWAFPPKDEPTNGVSRNDGRIVPLTLPYRPEEPYNEGGPQSILVGNFYRLVAQRYNFKYSQNNILETQMDPITEGAFYSRAAIMKAAWITIIQLLEAGVLGFVEENRREQRAESWSSVKTQNPKIIENQLYQLYKILNVSGHINEATHVDSSPTNSTSVHERIDERLFNPKERDNRVIAISNGNVDDEQYVARQKMIQAQMTFLPEYLYSVKKANTYFTNKVFARALSTAEAGEVIDVKIDI